MNGTVPFWSNLPTEQSIKSGLMHKTMMAQIGSIASGVATGAQSGNKNIIGLQAVASGVPT